MASSWALHSPADWARAEARLRSVKELSPTEIVSAPAQVLYSWSLTDPGGLLHKLGVEIVDSFVRDYFVDRFSVHRWALEIVLEIQCWPDVGDWKAVVLSTALVVTSEQPKRVYNSQWLFADSIRDEVIMVDPSLRSWWTECLSRSPQLRQLEIARED